MDDRKNQNREPEKGSGGGPKNRQTILIILICLLVSLMVMGLLNNALGGITSEDLDYSKFLDMVNNDGVQEVVLKSGTLTVTPKDQKSEGITSQVTMMGAGRSVTGERHYVPQRSAGFYRNDHLHIADRHSAGCNACRCHGMGDAQHEQRRRSHGRRKEQSKGLRTERNRRDIPRCCGTGRGKRIAPGGCGFSA